MFSIVTLLLKNTVILLKLSVTSAYSMPFNPFELKNKKKTCVCIKNKRFKIQKY